MNLLEEEKFKTVLQFYLSLHEAYDIWDAIIDDKTTSEQIEAMLKGYSGDWLATNITDVP